MMASWPSTRDPKGPMKRSIGILNKQKIQSQDADGLPESAKRFADGSRYKIEIPSVEGPAAFKVVIDEAILIVELDGTESEVNILIKRVEEIAKKNY